MGLGPAPERKQAVRSLGRRTAVVLCSAALVATAAACSSSTNSGGSSSSGSGANSASGATYTAAEVAGGSGVNKVVPLFAVPKSLPSLRLAFINPGLNEPFFAAWNQGMQAAAKFYKVQLDIADDNLTYDDTLSKWQQLAVKSPDVLGGGAGAMNAPTVSGASAAKVPVVLIDQTQAGTKSFGVPDQQAGQLAMQTLTNPIKQKMAGPWKGKTLYVVGITAPQCTPCVARIEASFALARSTFNIPASQTVQISQQATDPTVGSQQVFTDFLTAHPNDVVAVVSYGDETVVGAVHGAKAAGRSADVLAVSDGGDLAARQALRDPTLNTMFIASVDFQPYAEGWNWVEAAIATHLGKPFSQYKISRVLTPSNVNTYYPADK